MFEMGCIGSGKYAINKNYHSKDCFTFSIFPISHLGNCDVIQAQRQGFEQVNAIDDRLLCV